MYCLEVTECHSCFGKQSELLFAKGCESQQVAYSLTSSKYIDIFGFGNFVDKIEQFATG